jgi:uncharacterized coiled-coil DUF342 family protein
MLDTNFSKKTKKINKKIQEYRSQIDVLKEKENQSKYDRYKIRALEKRIKELKVELKKSGVKIYK